MKKIKDFFKDVKKEMAKVRWPNKKEMLTYSLATIFFIVFFGLFFAGSELLIALVKMLVR